MLGVLVQAAMGTSELPPPVQAEEWHLNGAAVDSCAFESSGYLSARQEVDLNVNCAADDVVTGSIMTALPATALRQRRVTVSVEIKTAAGMHASLWFKSLHGSHALQMESDAEQALFDDAAADAHADTEGWVQRSLTLPVSAEATSLQLGLLLEGSGSVQARNVRIDLAQPGAMAPAAEQLLQSAIDILKNYTRARQDLQWQVLEPQARIFASGAQSTAEVYPAIRYLLTQLGSKDNQFFTPEFASLLWNRPDHATASASKRFAVFALPDGAGLALAMEGEGDNTLDTRTAHVQRGTSASTD